MTDKELLEIKTQLEIHEKKLDSLMLVLVKTIQKVSDLEGLFQEVAFVVESAHSPAVPFNTTHLS